MNTSTPNVPAEQVWSVHIRRLLVPPSYPVPCPQRTVLLVFVYINNI